jgi:hypothetical protein
VNREGNGVASPEGHNFYSALHARTLFCQDKLTAGEIPSWLGKQDRYLKRKSELTIQILMQAVEVTGDVLKKQWCRLGLPSVVTQLQ